MRNLLLGAGLGLVVLATSAAPAGAAPILFNSHYYDVVLLPNVDWGAANNDVSLKSDLGLNWYLATITSQPEQEFIASLLGVPPVGGIVEYWVGGYQPVGSSEPSGGWSWVTGESFGPYTGWGWRTKQPGRSREPHCPRQPLPVLHRKHADGLGVERQRPLL